MATWTQETKNSSSYTNSSKNSSSWTTRKVSGIGFDLNIGSGFNLNIGKHILEIGGTGDKISWTNITKN